jgi:hypothetical protein
MTSKSIRHLGWGSQEGLLCAGKLYHGYFGRGVAHGLNANLPLEHMCSWESKFIPLGRLIYLGILAAHSRGSSLVSPIESSTRENLPLACNATRDICWVWR